MKIYLAPMEGITTYVFRNAFEKYYGGVDKYFTPFLTASHLKGRERRDVDPDNNCVEQLVPQILTNDAGLFVKIAEQLMELGYREVNLNLGCPSGTVVSKGRGAGFLDRTDELERFLYEIYDKLAGKNLPQDTKMNISIKSRLGVEFLSEWDDILAIYQKYPVSEIIVHPRLRNEFYNGEVHLNLFLKTFSAMKQTPICYNGDITDTYSFDDILWNNMNMFKENDQDICLMIGRGVLMNPLLPMELRRHMDYLQENVISDDEQRGLRSDKETFRSFISEIAEEYITEMSNEKQVVMKMKELWSYFSKGLGLDGKMLKQIHKAERLSDYKSAVQMILSQW
ncbi:tRNA-U20a,U20b-dihydrouridine synthase [Lachnospiraceae bacterium]|nr:tRNA-U20a,U20b-dihydrouridine synthase [Lachnospiraceae bacterium]